MSHTAAKTQDQAGDLRSKVARVGLIGKGLLYSLLGFLAINIALGNRDSASKGGAIERVAQAPFGKFLLIGLTVALIALVAWKLLEAAAGDPVDGSDATDRAKNGIKGLLYGASALTAVLILVANWTGGSGSGSAGGGGSGGGSGGKQKGAAVVMGLPAGRWIVMVIGIVIIGFGCYTIYQHTIKAEFMERIGSLDEKKEKMVSGFGRAGFLGRGGLMIGVGTFFFFAGVNSNSDNVKGLSGILNELAGSGWGQLVLWLLALGTFAYGLFAFMEARYRRAT